ncbi:MAG: putative baseplate assembly protein [Dehalococcoidia bacterium]
MPLRDPKLDDRSFQEIVNETKKLIPKYTPEWTDHNLSDPGVTLIELFAWMTELMLFRLNRVPDKTYIRFMDLLGIELKEAVPARTMLTFRLSAPQTGPVRIARGTEVATIRTNEQEAIGFTTDEGLVITPPTLEQFLFSADDVTYVDYMDRLGIRDEYFDAFQEPPLPGDALHLGFGEDLSSHMLELRLTCLVEGIGVDPDNPPLSWEAWCGEVRGWVAASVVLDETGGLNESGRVHLDLPPGLQQRTIARRTAYWVRLRVVQPGSRQPMYSQSPRINTIDVASIGGSVAATHSDLVQFELLGSVSGAPGETFELQHTPILARLPDEYLEIETEDGWTKWSEVATFAASEESDLHYRLDGVTGELSFGPVIRDMHGDERAYGAQPPRGASLRMRRYRQGGGLVGNVGAGTLSVIKSAIPFVSSVTNRLPATGGLDAESLDAAKLRVPEALASQERAVTARDYEYLAKEASRRVARARCIAVRGSAATSSVPPGTVELLIVPTLPADTPRTLDFLQPPPDLLEEVRSYLDERRLLGTQLAVDGPAYVGVTVEASIVVRAGLNRENVRLDAEQRITRYLDPLLGGTEGRGWPFGRHLYLSEVQSVLQAVPGVEYAQDVTIYQVDLQTNQARAAGQRITLADDVLLLSIDHRVSATSGT